MPVSSPSIGEYGARSVFSPHHCPSSYCAPGGAHAATPARTALAGSKAAVPQLASDAVRTGSVAATPRSASKSA